MNASVSFALHAQQNRLVLELGGRNDRGLRDGAKTKVRAVLLRTNLSAVLDQVTRAQYRTLELRSPRPALGEPG